MRKIQRLRDVLSTVLLKLRLRRLSHFVGLKSVETFYAYTNPEIHTRKETK